MWTAPAPGGGFNTPTYSNGTLVVAAWNAVEALNAATGALLWTFSDPRPGYNEWSDPAIASGAVVTGVANGGATLYAFDLQKGAVLWKDDFGTFDGVIGGAYPRTDGFYVPLATQNEPVGCGRGSILSIDLNGNVLWTHDTAQNIGDGNGVWAAPNLGASGQVLDSVGNNCQEDYSTGEGDSMVALDPNSGNRIWMFQAIDALNAGEPDLDFGSTPVDANGTVVAVSKSGWAYGVNDTTGAMQWKFQIADHNSGPELGGSISSPAFDGTQLYLGGGARADQVSGTGNFDALTTSGVPRWEVHSSAPVQSPATISNDLVFVGMGNSMVALSKSDGSTKWRADTNGYIWSGACIVGSVLYFASTDGSVYAYGLTASSIQMHNRRSNAKKR